MKCAVWNCVNERNAKNTKISFFSFPKDYKEQQKWLKFCRRANTFRPNTWRVCSQHFKDEDIEGNMAYQIGFREKRLLRPGAIPCIYKTTSPKAQKRLKRLQLRERKEIVDFLLKNATTSTSGAESPEPSASTSAILTKHLDQVCTEHSQIKVSNVEMGTPTSDVDIKEENDAADLCSPVIFAAKIYRIAPHPTGDINNVYTCVPKVEEVSYESDSDYILPDDFDAALFGETLLEVKEEVPDVNGFDISGLKYEENADYYKPLDIKEEEFVESRNDESENTDLYTPYDTTEGNVDVLSKLEIEFVDEQFVENSTLVSEESDSMNTPLFPNKEAVTVRISCARLYTLLLCPFCGIEYPGFIEWRNHLNEQHDFNKMEALDMEYVNGSSMAKCLRCNTEVSSKTLWLLQQHRIQHLPYKRYVKCTLCYRPFASTAIHQRHLEMVHEFIDPTESSTSQTKKPPPHSSNKDTGFSHLRTQRNCKFAINKCGNLAIELPQYNISKCELKYLYNRTYKCEKCGEYFYHATSYKEHMEVMHSYNCIPGSADYIDVPEPKTFIILLCPFCAIEFSDTQSWRNHLKLRHQFHKHEYLNMLQISPSKAKCLECHCVVSSKVTWSLQQHKIIHLPHKKYVKCELCGKHFSSVVNHKRHMQQFHSILETLLQT